MTDQSRQTKQLIKDFGQLRQQFAASQAAETDAERTKEALCEKEGRLRMLLERTKNGTVEIDSAGNVVAFNRAYRAMLGGSHNELMESLENVVYSTDDQGVVTCVNGAVESLLGYSPSEVLGRPFNEFVHQEDLSRVTEDFANILSGECRTVEYRLVSRSGESRWVRASCRPILQGESPRGVLGVLSDVTTHRRAEEARKASHHLLNLASRYTEMGPLLEAFVGEIKGFTGCDSVGIRMLDGDAFHTKCRKKDGEMRDFQVSGWPVTFGGKSFILFALADITEARPAETVIQEPQDPPPQPVEEPTAEPAAADDALEQRVSECERSAAALQESERQFRALVEEPSQDTEQHDGQPSADATTYTYSVYVEEGVAVSDEHGAGCLPVTGYSPQDFASDPHLWISMVHPDDRQMVREHVSKALVHEEMSPLEHRIFRKDGALRWLRNTIIGHFDGDGRIVRYDGVIEDITDRKQAEEEL